MYRVTLVLLIAVLAVVLAAGQYYVPRAYYTIDSEGHASAPIPLRRLRRNIYPGAAASANANAVANANAWGQASANANAEANANARGWGQLPIGQGYNGYGAANPNALSPGLIARQAGPIYGGGRSVSARSSVGLDSSGSGYYDQETSVSG